MNIFKFILTDKSAQKRHIINQLAEDTKVKKEIGVLDKLQKFLSK